MRTVGKYGLRLPAPGKKWGLKFSDYVDATALPPIPKGAFGHTDKVKVPWGILMNDQLGCCVVSGAEHETMLWTSESGSTTAVFDDASTVKNYELLGNYQPGNPSSDGGCDMLTAAELRIKQGIVDAAGNVHKLGIALELDCAPGYLNMEQVWYALYYFDGVGFGIGVTNQMEQDFQDGVPWDGANYNPNAVVGGHYVPGMGRENENGSLDAEIITWGEPQAVTASGLTAMTNTVLCYASQEKLRNGVDLEGLSWSDMRADISKVARM